MKSMPSRRDILGGALGASIVCGSLPNHISACQETAVDQNFRIRNGRIRQSVMGWCFNPMPVPELIGHCRDIGLVAIEGIPSEYYGEARKQGLQISLVSSHGFAKGPSIPAIMKK